MSSTTYSRRQIALQRRFAPASLSLRRSSVLPLELKLVCAYAFLLPYQIKLAPDIRFAPSDLCVLIAALCVAGRFTIIRSAWSVWHLGLMLTFVIGSLVTSVLSGTLSRYEFLNKDVGILLFFVTYLLVTTAITDWSQLRLTLRAFVKSTVLLNIVSLTGFLLSYAINVETPFAAFGSVQGGRRLTGLLLDPNAYGGLLVLALMLCETAAHGAKPLLQGTWLMLGRVTLAAGILFTFSRTAWIALALGMLFMVRVRIGTAIRVGATVAGAMVLALLLAGDQLASLFQRMIVRPEAGRGRGELMEKAVAYFTKHPIFGGGIGGFIDDQGLIVHNTALWFLADFGLFGFTVFTGFMLWFFFVAKQARKMAPVAEKPIADALLIGHVAMGALSMGIEAFYQRHWWLVMALIACNYHIASKTQQSQREGPVGWLPRLYFGAAKT